MRAALTLWCLLCWACAPVWAQAPGSALKVLEGRLDSGAPWRIEVPSAWNGTVLLYSRGYSLSNTGVVRMTAGQEREALLSRGYALAASSYSRAGWSVQEAVPDQLAVLDVFARQVGTPRQVLAWGSSMGGLITLAMLEQHSERFGGGLALCASAAGTLGMMNAALDGAWVFATLAETPQPLPVRLNRSGDEDRQQRTAWREAVAQAQTHALGRARIALAASLGQIPDWVPGQARPDPADVGAVQAGLQANLLAGILLPRDDQELRAGGNYSWNQGVSYTQMLMQSQRLALVQALYAQAGASLQSDLDRLEHAPRVHADPAAVAYMRKHYVPSGQLTRSVLLVQTVSDPLTLAEFTEDYARTARAAGHGEQVRTAYIERAGHCNFTSAEVLSALQALQTRADGDDWRASAVDLNRGAGADTFVEHRPSPLFRACSTGPLACPGAAP